MDLKLGVIGSLSDISPLSTLREWELIVKFWECDSASHIALIISYFNISEW